LRVALIAPFIAVIDDRRGQIGGAQSIIADLARGLASRGHAVTLVAPRGSHVAGVAIQDLGFGADPTAALQADGPSRVSSQGQIFTAVRQWIDLHEIDFDVFHAHAFDAPALEQLRGPRVIHTLHLPPLDPAIVAAARSAYATLATVSNSCREDWNAAGVPVAEVLPNGVDIDAVPEGAGQGGYLAFAGRISPEKGADAACRVARELRLPLRLAGPIYDNAYFLRDVRPLLGPAAEYDGALDRPALWRMLGGASATLLPIRWDEPFGLVALESLATGTPVVAYARGGLREIVVDGRSGVLAPPDDERALIEGVRAAMGSSRAACRADARRHDLPRMVDAHERLYRRVGAS
jgi:UDP-glucose:tetrahydrobiopterin glucosyltransferase